MSSICTTCPYCGVGCGIRTDGKELQGDSAHPANAGRLCVKGSSVLETLGDQDRLLYPDIDGGKGELGPGTGRSGRAFSPYRG